MDLNKLLITIDNFEERKSFEWIILQIGEKSEDEKLLWLKEFKDNSHFENTYREDIIQQSINGILMDCFEENVILHIESFINDLYFILSKKLNME